MRWWLIALVLAGCNARREEPVATSPTPAVEAVPEVAVEPPVAPPAPPVPAEPVDAAVEPAEEDLEPDLSAPSIAAISKLLGQPLASASRLFGEQRLRLEAGDDVEGMAEADPTEGHVRVKFAWMDDLWEITVRIDKKTRRIDHIVMEGEANGYAEQFALMKQLEAVFGPRRPLIDETGDPIIGFGNRSDVRASKEEQYWEIELRR